MQVDVVCPFIDDHGVRQLQAWARHSKARLAIYTRNAQPYLLDVAAEAGWRVHQYQGTVGEDPHRGFHCKFFLADDREAVLGSVNLVYHNMIENLELGFRTDDGGHVAALADVVATLRRVSALLVPRGRT